MDIKANRFITISYNDDEETKAIIEAEKYLSLGYDWVNGEIKNGEITIAELFPDAFGTGTVVSEFSNNNKWHIQLEKTFFYKKK